MNSKKYIPLASPNITSDDIDSVVSVLNSGMLIQGKFVESFENKIKEYTKTKEAIAVSNGTATMHATLVALGIKEGDEVLVPAFSYIATANVVELVGAKPIFIDIDIDTFNIDVTKIESKITPKTKAIIPVHEFGLACDIKKVCEIATKHNIYVIEDAACALGAKQDETFVGSFGIAGSFSFHPRKSITSGEGGIVTTNDIELAKKIKQLRNHGIDPTNSQMDFVVAGYNYRMTDIQAALVNSQMSRFDDILAQKNELAQIYFTEITNSKIKLPSVPIDRNHTWQTFHILLDDSLNQSQVINYFKENNIGVNYGAQCIPAQTFFKNKYNLDYKKEFPNAFKAYQKGIALPLYEKLNKSDIQYISKITNQL
jgi:dTDP-4-amino-4,6-dideoxygalactose transaminase